MLTLSRTRTRLSTWLTYLLAASVLSIIPSALWLPTSPANAVTPVNGATSSGSWTVPTNVNITQITVTIAGGGGGSGGQDCGNGCTSHSGSGGGLIIATVAVSPGQVVWYYPGGAGGNGATGASGNGGGTAGASSYSGYSGGTGGNAGSSGSSGAGGGGGGASVLLIGSTLTLVAGGGGGGGGAGNLANSGTNGSGTYSNYSSSTSTTGQNGINESSSTCSDSSNDGGGSGGGGGGYWGGAQGTLYTASGTTECLGNGGYVGGNLVTNGASATTNNYNSNAGTGSVTITYTATLQPPSGISATANTPTSEIINFTSAAQASSTTMRIWSAATGGTQVGSDYQSFVSGSSATGLTANTTYYVGLTSIGSGDYTTSAESTRVAFTTLPAANTPTITTQPSNLSKTSPQAASLLVVATGNGTLSYQWQVKVGGTGSFSNVTYGTGGTSSTYTLDTTHYTNNDLYQVIVTNTLNGTTATATSNTATLTLASALTITTPSTGLSATAGTAYSLSFTGSSLVSGGKTPYLFSTGGTLPPGLTLSNSATGVISGIPTTTGTYPITTIVNDANSASATTNSYSIVVSPGPTVTLVKSQIISSSSPSGATIATQPTFTLQDTYGNTATNDATAVVASIFSGSGGTLRGTLSVTPSSGVATFSNLTLDGKNNTAYVLQFTHTGAATVYETITTTTGTATQVVLGTSANVTTAAGALLAQQPIAYIEDSGGNIVNSTASVSMAITAGVGGSISGTTTVSAVTGTATFSGISIGGVAGTMYGVLFTSSGLSSAGSNYTVNAGTANSLALTTQPAGYPNGAAAIVQPVVSLTDSFGNIANNNSDTITATVSAGATLTGTTSVVTSSGSATFTNLSVSGTPGSQYTLTFTNSLTNKTVSQTQVVPGSATDTAMTFDGASTYAITSSLTMAQASNTTFTSEVWANPASGTCTNQQVIWERNTLGGSNASNYGWSLFCQSSTWYAAYYNTNTSAWGYITLGPVELGQWQHLAFTFTSSSWAFVGYINGIMTVQATISNTTTFNSTSTPIEVGGNGSSSLNFNGMIDEFKFWSVVRTSSQIASDMNTWGPVAANNGLVLYYDFNDVTPSTIFDKAWGAVTAENLTLSGSYSMVDMKNTQTCKLSNHTCIAFTRTYLNPFGGYQVPSTVTSASVLVVGGGGGGTAQTDNTGWVGGGGGAGGYQVFNSTALTPSTYVPVIVGAGGYGGTVTTSGWGIGLNGSNSQFGSLAASVGGGAGGGQSSSSAGTVNGANGGSGGGGGTYYTSTGGHGGLATSGQGNVGGNALATCCGSGGGGGSSGAGAYPTSNTTPALGGVGTQNPFVGSAYLAAGGNGAGGSGTGYYTNLTSSNGSVGTGLSAAANTGSGGGGGGGGGSPALAAGAGGSGVVLLEYITALPIVANPVNESATVATTTTFFDTNTAVTGLTRTFTWQYSSNGGTSWATAPNGTATYGTPSGSAGAGQVLANGSYVTPTLTNAMNNYQYRVVVVDTDSYGVTSTTTTSAATLTVNPAIVLITTPGSAVYGVSTGGGTAGYIQVQTGTGTGPFTFALNPTSSKYSLDTSTASSGFVNLVSLTSPAGTNYETVTVTDSSGATATGVIITTVTAAPTTTSFVAGAAFYNQPDTLTATVAESTVLTTAGTVTFKDSSNNVLCTTSTFNASDQASCAWTPASTNTYVITAYFVDGAGNFASSQSGATSISPGKASITESVTASTAAVAGATGANALQITATLNPTGSVSPGGTVAFTVNGANACLAASVSNSIATCSYTAQGAGIQSISAVYSGDSTFNGANASTTTSISTCNQSITVNSYLTGAPGAGYCAVEFTAGANGTWTVPKGVTNAQVLIVGGGGAGGERAGGGGGAGELLYTPVGTPLTLVTSTATITVGAGGQIETSGERGSVGGASSFATSTTYSAYGGGYGGGGGGAGVCGATGGSSGGNDGGTTYCTSSPAATSHTYSGFTSLVNNGGYGTDNNAGGNAERWSGGGGGGAGSVGGAGVTTGSYTGSGTSRKYTTAGGGGSGVSVGIALNTPTGCYAAGGGGGVDANSANYDLGNIPGTGGGCGQTVIGGTGTAGGALSNGTNYATPGTDNTGSGGGGAGFTDSYSSPNYIDGRAGKGGSGVVIVKYLSPSVITTNWDASGDTTTVTSGTSLTLAETATVFTFTRTTSWQYSVDGGTTWSLETATATAGANSSSGNSSPTLSYTFVIRCGLNTGTCKSATTQYLFRAMVIDTDTVTNLVTDSFSPTITVNVTALPFASLLTIISTSATYIANSPFTLATSGGGGVGAITYSLSGTGTATGCAITGAALRTTSTGTCKVIAVQAGDLDYVVETTTVTTINFYTYISYVNQYTAPVGSHGIGGGVSGGGINNTQTTGSTVITVTGMTPTSGAAQTSIVVTGTNFQTSGISKIASISFNFGLDPVSFVVNSPTQLTITLPTGENGVVDQFAIQPVSGAIVYTPTFTGLP